MIKKVIAILMSAGIIITSLSGCSIDKTILGNDVTIDGETCKDVSFKTIRKQLNGQIPSTTDGQNADNSKLVNADNININDMGTQGGKKGKDGEEKGFPEDKSNKKFSNDKNNKEMNENKN